VNRPFKDAEVKRLRISVQRGRPYGDEAWARRTAKELGLEHTFREAGRPKKAKAEGEAQK
jgi:putative transposase